MSNLKSVVALTNCNTEKLSRHDLLEWINTTAHTQHRKIEELCSGIAYCQLLEQMFPHCIGVKKIKANAKLEHEYLHNLKLIQSALTRLKFENTVPIDRLIKGRFQDNFEFLQWFKKFYDTYGNNAENNSPGPMASGPITAKTSSQKKLSKSNSNSMTHLTPERSNISREERSISPSSVNVLQETLLQLAEQSAKVDQDRNIYYQKLVAIETILNKSLADGILPEWSQKGLDILYDKSTDDHNAENIGESL